MSHSEVLFLELENREIYPNPLYEYRLTAALKYAKFLKMVVEDSQDLNMGKLDV